MFPPLRAYWMGRQGRGAMALSWSRSDFATMHCFFAPRRWPQFCRRCRRRRTHNPMALQSCSELFHPLQLHNRRLEICRRLMPLRRFQRCPAYRVGFTSCVSRHPKTTRTPVRWCILHIGLAENLSFVSATSVVGSRGELVRRERSRSLGW